MQGRLILTRLVLLELCSVGQSRWRADVQVLTNLISRVRLGRRVLPSRRAYGISRKCMKSSITSNMPVHCFRKNVSHFDIASKGVTTIPKRSEHVHPWEADPSESCPQQSLLQTTPQCARQYNTGRAHNSGGGMDGHRVASAAKAGS